MLNVRQDRIYVGPRSISAIFEILAETGFLWMPPHLRLPPHLQKASKSLQKVTAAQKVRLEPKQKAIVLTSLDLFYANILDLKP